MGEQYDLDIKYAISAMPFDHLSMLKLFRYYLNTLGPTMLYRDSNDGYGYICFVQL